jgi:hypothetical protein
VTPRALSDSVNESPLPVIALSPAPRSVVSSVVMFYAAISLTDHDLTTDFIKISWHFFMFFARMVRLASFFERYNERLFDFRSPCQTSPSSTSQLSFFSLGAPLDVFELTNLTTLPLVLTAEPFAVVGTVVGLLSDAECPDH